MIRQPRVADAAGAAVVHSRQTMQARTWAMTLVARAEEVLHGQARRLVGVIELLDALAHGPLRLEGRQECGRSCRSSRGSCAQSGLASVANVTWTSGTTFSTMSATSRMR